jgi:hypothetical protein
MVHAQYVAGGIGFGLIIKPTGVIGSARIAVRVTDLL